MVPKTYIHSQFSSPRPSSFSDSRLSSSSSVSLCDTLGSGSSLISRAYSFNGQDMAQGHGQCKLLFPVSLMLSLTACVFGSSPFPSLFFTLFRLSSYSPSLPLTLSALSCNSFLHCVCKLCRSLIKILSVSVSFFLPFSLLVLE